MVTSASNSSHYPVHDPRGAGTLSVRSHLNCAAYALLMLSLSGCTNDLFTNAAGQLGALTKAAAQVQDQRLSGVAADERARYRQDLANRHAHIKFQDCAVLLATDTATDKRCRLVERAAPGSTVELAPETRFDNVITLNNALIAYADGLIALTAESSKDQAAFSAAAGKLAGAVGGLDGAIQKATGQPSKDRIGKFNAIGEAIAKMGNLNFGIRRRAASERIIIAADPLIQRAVVLLSDTDDQVDLYDRAALYGDIADAQAKADEAVNGGNADTIKSAQKRLFDVVDRYNAYKSERARYLAIGEAHTKLVAAAKSQASLAEVQAAIVSLLDLASTIDATRKAFDQGDK